MIPTPNDGSRPSHLQLDRYATGELSPDEAARVEASLDATSRAHLAAVENAAADLPPLDVAAVRRRAIVDPARPLPAPVNDTRAFRRWWMAGLAVAAALALFVVSPWPGGDPDAPPDVVFRGGDLLTVYAVEGSDRQPYVPGTPLGSGDTIGFSVDATGHTSVVLLSIDGAGTLTALYPEQVTDEAFPLSGTGRVALPELVTLDDAPGPEVFVAALDRSTEEIATEMLRVYGSGGHPALLAWAAETPGVDAVEVTKQ